MGWEAHENKNSSPESVAIHLNVDGYILIFFSVIQVTFYFLIGQNNRYSHGIFR